MLHRLSSGPLTATIDSRGAQLTSLTHDGVEYIWGAVDPWNWSAPVLFPIISGLPGDTLVHEGRDYTIPSHGFARRTEWAAIGEGHFELVASPVTREQYPFDFRLIMRFTLGDELTVTHTVVNEGTETLPYLLGAHPAFLWPLPGAQPGADHVVSWRSGGETMRQAVQGLRAGRIPSPASPGRLILDRAFFAEDALLFDDLDPREVEYTAAGAATLRLRYNDFSRLGIWSKPNFGDFVCLEPWTGYPAPQGFSGDIVELPEAELLAVGDQREYSYSIAIEGAR